MCGGSLHAREGPFAPVRTPYLPTLCALRPLVID